MRKTFISSSIIALSLGVGILGFVPAHAEEINTGTVPGDGFTATSDDELETISVGGTSDNAAEPSSGNADAEPIFAGESTELEDTIDHEGTSGEPEVICADPTEPGCEDAAVEDEIDPELWPLIISLAALGLTVLFVIIFNIIGRKRKK